MNLAHKKGWEFYVGHASDDGRLYLARSVGPLSGGTRIKLVSTTPDYSELEVSAPIQVPTHTRQLKVVEAVVPCYLGDVVIRRRRSK